MGRYLNFGANHFDFATRAEFSIRKEYFEDFVLGGARDIRVFGLTRITPQITAEYDVNGLKFLSVVLGSISTDSKTIVTAATVPMYDYKVTVEDENMSISNAKVDSWEITIEEGNPVRAEFTAIGKGFGTDAATSYTPDFDSPPVMPHQCTITINGATVEVSRISVRINNALETIFKTSSLPVDIRETGLEVTGRIRARRYGQFASEGSMDITLGTIGVITLPDVRFTEIPPRVSGFDLPETELSYSAYPKGSPAYAIKVVLSNTVKW